MGFKTPDGKEFETKKEWRKYMYENFYSFTKKENESEPLVKAPGTIDGQMFDMSDCVNSTLVVLDHCEQVQMDVMKKCRVFVGKNSISCYSLKHVIILFDVFFLK